MFLFVRGTSNSVASKRGGDINLIGEVLLTNKACASRPDSATSCKGCSSCVDYVSQDCPNQVLARNCLPLSWWVMGCEVHIFAQKRSRLAFEMTANPPGQGGCCANRHARVPEKSPALHVAYEILGSGRRETSADRPPAVIASMRDRARPGLRPTCGRRSHPGSEVSRRRLRDFG